MEVRTISALGRKLEWCVLKVLLLLSGFPFFNNVGKISVDEHVVCKVQVCRM